MPAWTWLGKCSARPCLPIVHFKVVTTDNERLSHTHNEHMCVCRLNVEVVNSNSGRKWVMNKAVGIFRERIKDMVRI